MIPDDIRRFIAQCVPSVPYLEALLLLRGSKDNWMADRLARQLYLDGAAAGVLLEQLLQAQLLVRDPAGSGAYLYAPAMPEMHALIDELATVYQKNLVEVSTLIHAKSTSKAVALANAFFWRRKE